MYNDITDADRTFKERNYGRENEAEVYVERWFVENNCKFAKYGFDEKNGKVDSDIWFKLPQFIRSTPDYIVYRNKVVFFEVKGYRKEIKLKEEDLKVYKYWNSLMDLYVFFRNFDTKQNTILSFDKIMEKIPYCEMSAYEDNGKKYYILKEY
tara:strand:- start:178 stop:633 length:456 start_codon:yes stop_codon:yes gene_type:complete